MLLIAGSSDGASASLRALVNPEHWNSMRALFGDPDLAMPSSDNWEAEEAYSQGLTSMRQGNALGALSAFRRADQLGHAGAPRELAASALADSDFERARDFAARARERGDGNGAATLGNMERTSSPQRAFEHYRFADSAGDPEGARGLGGALWAMGKPAEAEAALRRSDERGSASGSLALGIFLRDERRDMDGAEAAFRRAEQRGHPKGSLNLIDIYAERGDVEAGEGAEERALELAARHRTVFEEMQGPNVADAVRGRTRAKVGAAAGGGCALPAALGVLAASIVGVVTTFSL